MAITYTKTTIAAVTDLAATASVGGSLTVSQFWFLVVPITSAYTNTLATAIAAPSNIATATTDASNKTIALSWSAPVGALGYLLYWTKVNPLGNPMAFNTAGYHIKNATSTNNASVTTNSFSFSTEQLTGSPNYSVLNTDAYRFPVIYNENTDYISVTSGATDADRFTFEKLYQYCLTAGWDTVQKKHDRVYYVKANIDIHAGGIVESKNELVYTIGGFSSSGTGNITYLGTGTSDLDSEEGSTWISLAGQGSQWNSVYTFNTIRAYNFHFRNLRPGYSQTLTAQLARYTNFLFGADFQIANCVFDCLQYLQPTGTALATSFIKDVSVLNSRWAWRLSDNLSAATLENLYSIRSGLASYLRFSPIVRGLNQKGSLLGAAIAINSVEDLNATLIDSNLDWTSPTLISWFNSGRTPTGNEYIKNLYTVDLTVIDNIGNTIEAVNIKLVDNNGVERMNMNTNSSGKSIYETEVGIHKSLATSANNAGVYVSYNPFTFTISKAGYETYTKKMTITGAINEVIKLKPVVAIRQGIGFKVLALDAQNGSSALLKKL